MSRIKYFDPILEKVIEDLSECFWENRQEQVKQEELFCYSPTFTNIPSENT